MLETLAASPVTRAIGLALLHFLWQGALIAAAAAWLFHILRRSASTSRYMVGCVALVTMAAVPIVTAVRVLNEPVRITTAAGSSVAALADVTPSQVQQSARESIGVALTTDSGVPTSAEASSRLLPAVVLIWSLGVVVLTLNLTGAWIRSIGLRRSASPVGEPWRSQLEAAAGRLGVVRRIVLSQSSLIDVPTLVGWIRPAIVVPASVLAGLTPAQLDAILTHELAHIRRHDYLANLFQSVVETLLFYHPAVWWLSRRIRIERELCCDDIVVAVCDDRIVYARALASLEELRDRRPVLGVAATGGNLLDRVRRILAPDEIDDSRSSAWSVLATAVVVIAPMFFVGGVGETATSAEPRPSADIALAAPESSRDVVQTRPAAVATAPLPQTQKPATAATAETAVLALEEQFRLAKVEANIQTLERLLDDAFVETNQNGNMRDKNATLDLWRTFRIKLLTLDSTDVQMIGDLARSHGAADRNQRDRHRPHALHARLAPRQRHLEVVLGHAIPRSQRQQDTAASGLGPRATASPRVQLFKNDALLGRPTVTTVSGRPWTIEIPGETPVSVVATASGSDGVNLTFLGGAPPASMMSMKGLTLSGSAPQELVWTSGTSTYRLRIRTLANALPGPAPVSVGGDVRRPELVKRVDPIYPQAAKDAHVSGMVIVEIVVDEGGNIADAKIVRSVPMLDAAALDAVRQWQYTPTLLNGNPVKVAMSVNVTFSVR